MCPERQEVGNKVDALKIHFERAGRALETYSLSQEPGDKKEQR